MTRKTLIILAAVGPLAGATTASLADIQGLTKYYKPGVGWLANNHGVQLASGDSVNQPFAGTEVPPITDTIGDGVSMTSVLSFTKNGIVMTDDHSTNSAHVESNSWLHFKIDGKSKFSLSGSYSINAAPDAMYTVFQIVELRDTTAKEVIYEEWDWGYAMGSAVWNVGDDDSGFGFPTGALSGVLTDPTHVYSLSFISGMGDRGDVFTASAHSQMRFDIVSVPAPGAALLGFIGLGLTARARRWLAAC